MIDDDVPKAKAPDPQLLTTRVERRKEKTRRTLMEVALSLFYEKGIYLTKIEDVTARADIGKGTFYLYFETKESILLAVLEEGLDRLLVQATEAVETAKPGWDRIGAMIRSQLDFYQAHPEYLLLFHQVCGLLQLKTGAVRELKEVYDRYLNRLGRLAQPALNGKGGRAGFAREFGMALSAVTSGLLIYHLLFGKHKITKRWRADIEAQIERSLFALIAAYK